MFVFWEGNAKFSLFNSVVVTFFSFERLCILHSFIPLPLEEITFTSSWILSALILPFLLLVLYMLMFELISCQADFRKSIALLKWWFLFLKKRNKKIDKLFLWLIIEVLKTAGVGLKYFGSGFAIIKIGMLFYPSNWLA